MTLERGGNDLEGIVNGLVRTLEALCVVTPFELFDAELEIPFVGRPTRRTASVGLADFHDVSLTAKHVSSAAASDLWRLSISIAKGKPAVVRVESYDASGTA